MANAVNIWGRAMLTVKAVPAVAFAAAAEVLPTL